MIHSKIPRRSEGACTSRQHQRAHQLESELAYSISFQDNLEKLKAIVSNDAKLVKLVDCVISQNELFSNELENVCKENGIQRPESTNLKDPHHEECETEIAPTPFLLATLSTPKKKNTEVKLKSCLTKKEPGDFPNEFDIQKFKEGEYLSSDVMNIMINMIRDRNKRLHTSEKIVIISALETSKMIGIQIGEGCDFSCNGYEEGLYLGSIWRKHFSYLSDDYEKVEKKDCSIPYLVGEGVRRFIFQVNTPNFHWFTIEVNVIAKTMTLFDSSPEYPGNRVICEDPRITTGLKYIDWLNSKLKMHHSTYQSLLRKLFEETNLEKASGKITMGSLLPAMALQELLQLFRKENENRGSNVKGMDMEGWTLKVSSDLPIQYKKSTTAAFTPHLSLIFCLLMVTFR
ncbi:predicted protein [Chaetoceros tenuissimus]|uniref:Uncharacterized protein n=1 Tax=Chaetoceros tenuissimus TaxID=426638 RepID=A0AAD3HB72_9STRA|nr:predicted protein [Chaetoceros tenuissimus]